MIKVLMIGTFTFIWLIWLVVAYGGGSKEKKNRQSKEIVNMFTPKEDETKISEYEKYFDKSEPTYKGW